MPDIPNISVDNARKGFFEPADFAAVEQELPEALRMLMRFLYLTGWRAGEALGLTWAGVDFGGGVVRLEPGATKNGEGREFPFLAFPQLAELLHKQREQTSALEREQGRMIAAVFHRNGSPIHFPEIFQPRLESQLRAQVAWDRFESRRQINCQSLTRIVRQEAGTFYFDGVERPNTPDVLYGLGVERTRFRSRLELTTGSTLVRELNRHFAGDAWNLNIMVGVRYHPGK